MSGCLGSTVRGAASSAATSSISMIGIRIIAFRDQAFPGLRLILGICTLLVLFQEVLGEFFGYSLVFKLVLFV
jgi:hypothetical protein